MWASVTCGEAHALAIDEHGRLYAFGSNAHGQLGLGVAKNGGTQDAFLPTPVNPFFTSQRVVHAAAGPTHSAIIDDKGRAWTWGGGGHGLALLGHGARKPTRLPSCLLQIGWLDELQRDGDRRPKRVCEGRFERLELWSSCASPGRDGSMGWTGCRSPKSRVASDTPRS